MQEFSQIPIYLDNAATMKPSGAVLGSLVEDAADCFCNPMAAYPTASRVRGRMDLVKQALAQAWGVDKSTLCFLSGATEANNWVLTKGHKQKNACIVCSMSEHPSVYNVVAHLQATGSRVQYVTLDNKGRVDLDSLEHILSTTQVSLVSVMHLCGQTGAINDIARIVGLVKASNPSTLVHSDGVQAFGKFDCNLLALGVDFYTVSMHKVGGLKGVGVLYCKQGLHLAPLLFGGSGDLGGRPGTPNTTGILSSAKALADYQSAKTWGQYKEMREAFLRAFEGMEGVQVGGGVVGNSVSQSECAPHIISISIPGIKAEVLQSVLSDRVIVGIGSACNTKRSENRVLSATGLKKEQVEGTIRISFGSHNTMGEVQTAAQVIVQEIQKLRKIGA